jgi:RNA polymerase sigma-70 factor (ECF subfamily)
MPNLFSRRSRLMGQEGSDFTSGPERPALSDWASALSWGVDETRLVTELQAGSETAFDWLVTHYHGPVYNLILSMLGDVADAADGTQEVFLKAFRGIRSFRQGSSLKTWLYRIAIREALNHKRWFKRHLQKNVSIDAEPEEGHAAIEIEDIAATPFEQFAAHEIQSAVQSALQEIPEVFRSAVILRDLEGLSYEEIAEVLECSSGTVKSRILRGRRALKELLEPLLVDHSTATAAPDHLASRNAELTSSVASENDQRVVAYSTGSASVGARFSASSSAPRAGTSRMPRPAFAPHFGSHRNTVSARSRFARESSASEELP